MTTRASYPTRAYKWGLIRIARHPTYRPADRRRAAEFRARRPSVRMLGLALCEVGEQVAALADRQLREPSKTEWCCRVCGARYLCRPIFGRCQECGCYGDGS
jgi:hypothetical protein